MFKNTKLNNKSTLNLIQFYQGTNNLVLTFVACAKSNKICKANLICLVFFALLVLCVFNEQIKFGAS